MSTQEQPDQQATDRAGVNSGRRAWIFAVIASIAAAVSSWGIVEGVLLAYTPVFESTTKPYPTKEDNIRITRARIVSGTMTFGATGALLGLALGLAGGASSRSIKGAASAGMAGLLVGGIAEGGTAFGALDFIYKKMDLNDAEMLPTMLSHEALWVVVGLAGGLAFGLGRGGRGTWFKAAIGGLIGAAIATVAYEFIGALAFPTGNTQQPYADSAIPRALAQFLIPLGSAIGAVASMGGRAKKPVSPPKIDG